MSKKDANFVTKNFLHKLTPISDRPGFYEDLHHRSIEQALPNTVDKKNKFDNLKELKASSIINHFIYLTKLEIEEFYSVEIKSFVGGMTCLTEGAFHGPHADMYDLDGNRLDDEESKALEYSAILYLSDYGKDFLGGQLLFTSLGIEVKPSSGTLVFFKGDIEHVHEVRSVLGGKRSAIVMFFGS